MTVRRVAILASSVALNAFFALSFAGTAPLSAAPAGATGLYDSCHLYNVCPDPKSCGSWSTYYACGDPFCHEDPSCTETNEATYQGKERFRACILQDSSVCFEYQEIAQQLFCEC
jgi:hypothetical protein